MILPSSIRLSRLLNEFNRITEPILGQKDISLNQAASLS